jgi:DNA invertase Pin-like site-specific DNA recombinase
MKDGAIYARYSSHNQREESIEQQVAECEAFCAANDIRVVEVYADKAVSGRTDKRSQFQRMMKDAERRKFEVVVAYKSNRIARNMLNALAYEDKLERFGIQTFYVKEEFGNTASGRFALRTMMNLNQFYSENLAEDVKRGQRSNAEQLRVNGSIAFGYKKGEDGHFAIHEEHAQIVREIFDKAAKQIPLSEIASELNARGIKTRQNGFWNKGSFERMLRNRLYVGEYHHSGVVVQGGVPAIVDEDTFKAVQELLERKKPYARDADYVLTGKLFCGHCGAAMVGVSGTSRTGKLHTYYSCQNRRPHLCDKKNERKEELELLVARITRDIVLKDEFIEWLADETLSFHKAAKHASGLDDLERELAENKAAIDNVLSAIEAGIINQSVKERLTALEADQTRIKDAMDLLSRAYRPLDRERLIFALERFRRDDLSDAKYRRFLIQHFVKKVVLFDDRIEIDYYYSDGETFTAPLSSVEEDAVPPNAFQTNQAEVWITAACFRLAIKRLPA